MGPKTTGVGSVDCVYDNTSSTPITIPGTQNQSSIFNSTRFSQPNGNRSDSSLTDNYYNIRPCFPILLPPKFNWLPAPIGNLGSGFDIDDFTRFIVGFAIIIIAPNITKAIQDALKIKSNPLGSAKDAMQGAGVFNTFLGQIPIIGKPLSQITGGITGAVK